MLIITRLMFQPPDDPIFKARAEKIKERNGNHFYELALPYSSTMFRQGFGRLIRNETDSGVVALEREQLEKLITEKNIISI